MTSSRGVRIASLDAWVFDDFFDDPMLVREFALSCEYKKSLTSGTDALISHPRHPETQTQLYQIASLVGVSDPDWNRIQKVYRFWLEAGCGEFQFRGEASSHIGRIHSHPTGEWTGIIYLSLPQDCKDKVGTYFLQHKASGKHRYEDVDAQLYESLKSDSADFDRWNVLGAPDMQFNRLVLFDSRQFHAESSGFGATLSEGRLVQIFNFVSEGTLDKRQLSSTTSR